MIRTITATEYVMPLREGGSLPAIVDGDGDGTYVLKFRGGQGVRSLIAELVSGEIARPLGLPVPEIVFAMLVTNVDRTAKNTNLLVWHRNLWMIDHGATLIFHHNWDDHLNSSRNPFQRSATTCCCAGPGICAMSTTS